jgi:hypothetical protein
MSALHGGELYVLAPLSKRKRASWTSWIGSWVVLQRRSSFAGRKENLCFLPILKRDFSIVRSLAYEHNGWVATPALLMQVNRTMYSYHNNQRHPLWTDLTTPINRKVRLWGVTNEGAWDGQVMQHACQIYIYIYIYILLSVVRR